MPATPTIQWAVGRLGRSSCVVTTLGPLTRRLPPFIVFVMISHRITTLLLPVSLIGMFSLLLYSTAQAQSRPLSTVDCASFRTGKFWDTTEEGDTIFITRKKKIQTEQVGNLVYTLNVTWQGPCQYTLAPISRTLNGKKERFPGYTITNVIFETGDGYYKSRSSVKEVGFSMEITIYTRKD